MTDSEVPDVPMEDLEAYVASVFSASYEKRLREVATDAVVSAFRNGWRHGYRAAKAEGGKGAIPNE